MRKEHIKAHTGLRGLAAAFVALLHMHFADIIPHVIWAPFMSIVVGWYPVDVFFMLSGFILGYVYVSDVSNPKINYKDYLVKRVARIVPLHYLTILAVGFMAMVAWYFGLPNEGYHLNEIPRQLLMVQAWPYLRGTSWIIPSWYVSISFFAYLFLIPLLLKFVSKMRKSYLLIALSFLVLAMVWAVIMGNNTATGWPAITRMVCQFSIGYLLYSLTTFKNPISQLASKLVSVWLLLAIVWVFSCWPLPIIWKSMHNEFPLTTSVRLFQLTTSRMLFEIIFALLILGLADNKKSLAKTILANRIFLWLGTISYSIYLIHNLIGKVIHPFVDKIPDGIWIRILIIIGVYAFLLAASWSIYKFFEVPSRDYVIKFFSKSKISNKPGQGKELLPQ